MKWIASDGFLGTAREVRTVWLSGIFGTGKTLTSVAIAGQLLQQGWADSFIANIPVNGQDEPSVPMENCIVLLDEAHLFLPDWESVKAYSAFLRKVNMRLIMPSIYPPHSKLRILEIQRVFNGYRIGGMFTPFWQYKWRINAGMFSEKGTAILWKPHDLFGMYDTNIIMPEDADEVILKSVTETIALKQSKGLAAINPTRAETSHVNYYKDQEVYKPQNDKLRAIQTAARGTGKDTSGEAFRDAANTVGDAAQSIADSAERISRTLRKY